MLMASVRVLGNFDPAATSLQEVVCPRFHSRQTEFVLFQQHRFDAWQCQSLQGVMEVNVLVRSCRNAIAFVSGQSPEVYFLILKF